MLCFTVFLWLWLKILKKYLAAAKINLMRMLNCRTLLLLFYSVLAYCSTYNLKIYILVLLNMATLHITKVLANFLKQHRIYTENYSKNFFIWFRETFMANRGNLPIFHKAENLFDIFTCYVRTSMALVPSQYKKCAGNCSGKCGKITIKSGNLIFTWNLMIQSYRHNFVM